MAAKTISSCPICSYPLSIEFAGQTAVCAYCGQEIEVIAQDENGVRIPTPLFVSIIAFTLGVIVGPALIATTDSGQKWLVEQAKKVGK